jgi:probable phosphoglycerate mutase
MRWLIDCADRAERLGRCDDGPMGATRLVLIRHGESQVTVNRVIGGHRTCSGLSDLGRQQAERLHDRLADTHELDGALLISSQFDRAIETAQIIGPAIAGADLLIDPGFGEHDPGPDLDGMSFASYVNEYGSPNWGGDPHFEVFPGGETIAQFHLRVGSTVSRTLLANANRTIVVSCHGGVVDAIFRQLLRTAPTGAFDLWTTNTSLTEFALSPRLVDSAAQATGDPKWRLVRYNDAAHLAGLPAASNVPSESAEASQTDADDTDQSDTDQRD